MNDYAAPLAGCRCRWLHAPATNFIWTMRSPVSGDLLLSLAAVSIPARSPFSVIFSLVAIGFEHDRFDQRSYE